MSLTHRILPNIYYTTIARVSYTTPFQPLPLTSQNPYLLHDLTSPTHPKKKTNSQPSHSQSTYSAMSIAAVAAAAARERKRK